MYFCKNCGEPYMTDEAVMCVKCGVAKGQGNNYCHNCCEFPYKSRVMAT